MAEVYDEHKLSELILYQCLRSEGDATFGSTKLNKLLFECDFRSFLAFGQAVTAAEYQRLEFGPAPRQLVPVRQQLIEQGHAYERLETYFGKKQRRLLALREPDLSCFSDVEIELIDGVLNWAKHLNADEISKRSHGFVGWSMAEPGETIPYFTALLYQEFQDGFPMPVSAVLNPAEKIKAAEVVARIRAAGIQLPKIS